MVCMTLRWRELDSNLRFFDGMRPESDVRNRLRAGADWIQTFGSAKSCRRAGEAAYPGAAQCLI